MASVFIEKPAAGNFLPIWTAGSQCNILRFGIPRRFGHGPVLPIGRDRPNRERSGGNRLVGKLMGYVRHGSRCRVQAALRGRAAGKAHLENAKFAPADYRAVRSWPIKCWLSGPAAERKLAANEKEIQAWLKAGGRLLAMGLGQDEANAFLPSKVAMTKAEYGCGSYSLPAADSPFAGVAPADLYNRMPRELSLVSGGAATIGDGVLAKAEGADVVFCQLVPWQYDDAKNYFVKPTFRRFSFTLSRLLANMGVTAKTPLLDSMEEPLAVDGVKDSSSKQQDVGSTRWLSGLYLDKPEVLDDPYRYYRW